MKTTFKTARLIKPYATKFNGWNIIVPIGAIVSNKTACGYDDNYRFWTDFGNYANQLTGHKSSMLYHDLTHYGLNVPKEFCSEWEI